MTGTPAPRPSRAAGDTFELPTSGYRVEVTAGGIGLPQWRLHRLGDVAYAASTDLVGGRKLVLGARHSRPDERGSTPWAAAWGAVPVSGEPVHVRFIPRQRFLRRSRPVAVEPTVVGGLIWVAEATGVFEDVEVQAGALREGRLLEVEQRAGWLRAGG